MKLRETVLDSKRLKANGIRIHVERLIRDFFSTNGFLETRTPLLVPCPGMEPHIRPLKVESWAKNEQKTYFLPTSPEFAMKRLLVGGLERIFQICPAFRDEPKSVTHLPEFTILEWYRANCTYEAIMDDTEALFAFIATELCGKPEIEYQGRKISMKLPWPRLRVKDLFINHAGIDLEKTTTVDSLRTECENLGLKTHPDDTWDDIYFRIWLNNIESKLPENQAVIVHSYPKSQAALSVVEKLKNGSEWARRFEFYIGGLELGNAFQELTDPIEQRTRFVKDMSLRENTYGETFPKTPLDEGFLTALEEGLPPSSGIAVGVDRMVMLFSDEPDIEKTVWLSY